MSLMEDREHDHICMECGDEVECDEATCDMDEDEETLCEDCLEEQKELFEEENDAV